MSLFQAKLIEEKSFEINIIIDELDVLFKVNVDNVSFDFTLMSDDTGDRLYGYCYMFDRLQTVSWNIDDCIKKTHAHLGALVYSKKRGEFVVPHELEELAYHAFKKYTGKKEKCCICLEKAKNKTMCGHVCCHKCLVKVNICPICRENLYD
jgi:hypothetical protein